MKHTGPPPFGFEWNEDTLRLVEHEARVRRHAFELYAELLNKSAVAKKLNEIGYLTRKGRKWSDVGVDRLLSCSSARGLYAVNKTALNAAGERIEKPQDEWEFVECTPIVSKELWEQVQTALAEESAVRRPSDTFTHLFTGLLFCRCGARMNAASSSPKYVCAECGNRIPMTDLENVFLEEITSFLHSQKGVATESISGDPELAQQHELLRRMEKESDRIDEEISKAERLYEDGRITVERFESIHRPLQDKHRAVQRELGKIKAKLARLKSKHPLDNIPQFDPRDLRTRWPDIPMKERRNIARAFVDKIVVSNDEIEFIHRFRNSSERTAKSQQSPAPTSSGSKTDEASTEPFSIPLPKPGHRCPRTGMTRSRLNELILPTERNNYRPPVESVSLCPRDGGKGTRLIIWQSLKAYLEKRR
jgi:site-specific DNA recombinase